MDVNRAQEMLSVLSGYRGRGERIPDHVIKDASNISYDLVVLARMINDESQRKS
jgi:hypothetical protein